MTALKELRVLVTPTSYGRNDQELKRHLEAAVGEVVYNTTGRPLNSEELREIIGSFHGYIAGLDCIDSQVIRAAKNLKVIARYGVGVDAVDLQAAHNAGIVVTNTPGVNSSSVAELTVGLMLALNRNIVQAAISTRLGEWQRLNGTTLEGKTIGLLGFGAVGKRVAGMLMGFNCQVIAYDPIPDRQAALELNVELMDKNEVIGESNLLSLHLPLTAETRGMVDKVFIDLMNHGACLINTSRGELVVENHLFSALDNGHLKGAALDVFDRQPPDPENPLLQLPQVIATPHMGAHTDSAATAMGWGALDNCLRVLRGEEPYYRVV